MSNRRNRHKVNVIPGTFIANNKDGREHIKKVAYAQIKGGNDLQGKYKTLLKWLRSKPAAV